MELGGTIAKSVAGAALAGALLAGCSAGESGMSPTGALPVAAAGHRNTGSGQQLLYLSNFVNKQVLVYQYPPTASEQPYQTLTGLTVPLGECSNGTELWIVDEGAQRIFEYEAGGTTPIATLKGVRQQNPFTCAYDPTTGDLAVANGSTDRSNVIATVMVYKHATGKPKTYQCASIYHGFGHGFSFVGYDNKGNLFADAWGVGSYAPTVCELTRHARKMRTVEFNALQSPGQIQWDGKYLAIGDYVANVIYQVSVKKFKTTTKGTISLGGSYNRCIQFTIADQTVVCPTQEASGGTPVYDYPQGGSPVQVIPENNVWGTTIATMSGTK